MTISPSIHVALAVNPESFPDMSARAATLFPLVSVYILPPEVSQPSGEALRLNGFFLPFQVLQRHKH